MVCKILFCSECTDIPERFEKEEEQEVQGLQAFAFYVITVNDEHTKPRFKKNRRG